MDSIKHHPEKNYDQPFFCSNCHMCILDNVFNFSLYAINMWIIYVCDIPIYLFTEIIIMGDSLVICKSIICDILENIVPRLYSLNLSLNPSLLSHQEEYQTHVCQFEETRQSSRAVSWGETCPTRLWPRESESQTFRLVLGILIWSFNFVINMKPSKNQSCNCWRRI